ncbi:LysR family transcriptional regulator [Paenibacillus sp. UMB7766-LJ446]|uniref:LysR family transcriptional regulator n=1 Tax=Paenibacillus sp. UMB7766-LJ446 TaxID=3046313 RepID=UPI002550B30A|nr:LysR family transcriptional regulator [Paenibacillus sp. UMB7766-LJ446]MDK8192219.1 LysR family transcriptional regulator [Paenibacillus sp. UMB7766-LJ446]
MELTQLEYFLTVARLQHMTMASKALNLTQPALSHAISKLENELGVPLFERNGRNVQLNRYGHMFSKWVEEALKNIQNGIQEIDEWSNPETGVVHVSYLNILGVDLVPSIIRDYQAHHPKVRFDLYQGNHGDINEYLDKGTSDMLITSKESTLDNHEWIAIRKLPLFIVVPAKHHLANRSSLSLFELSGEPFVGLKKNCGLKATITTRFKDTNFELASTYDAEDLITVAGFIKAGLGVSVLPQTLGLMLDGLVWIPIEENGWEWEVVLKWRKDRYLSPAAKRLIDFISNPNMVFPLNESPQITSK